MNAQELLNLQEAYFNVYENEQSNVAYGEPNTDRHQMARHRRGQPSTKD